MQIGPAGFNKIRGDLGVGGDELESGAAQRAAQRHPLVLRMGVDDRHVIRRVIVEAGPQSEQRAVGLREIFPQSLADQFRRLLLADPIEKALWEGKLLWGDILCTPEEEERERVYREQREAEETAERAAATAVRPTFFGGFSKPSRTAAAVPAALERDVPAFPAGRLTLMAKNLPRDIDVKELRIIFEQYGAIRDIYIPKNMDKSSPYYLTIKGFALIKFLKPDDSARAFAAQYALVNIRGKNIALEPASADR